MTMDAFLPLQVPDVNAAWMDTFVRRYDQVHVNMLVRHDNRLSAPVISNIGGKGLATIAEELSRVESTAPDSDSFSIGTFSVHNLGESHSDSIHPSCLPTFSFRSLRTPFAVVNTHGG